MVSVSQGLGKMQRGVFKYEEHLIKMLLAEVDSRTLAIWGSFFLQYHELLRAGMAEVRVF